MFVESAILLVILIIIVYIYGKKGRVAIQMLLLPMAILPIANIISYGLITFEFSTQLAYGMYTAMLCIASVIVGVFASKIINKKFRATYIAIFIIYFIVYTVLRGFYILNLFS